MDRDRFRTCARDLVKMADQLIKLSTMPDRATRHDFETAATLVSRAAKNLEDLLEAQLPGCICRRIVDDNYNYIDYAEACQHHGSLFRQVAAMKARYEKIEDDLKNEARMKILPAALAAAATAWPAAGSTDAALAGAAFRLTDEVLRRLVGETKP